MSLGKRSDDESMSWSGDGNERIVARGQDGGIYRRPPVKPYARWEIPEVQQAFYKKVDREGSSTSW